MCDRVSRGEHREEARSGRRDVTMAHATRDEDERTSRRGHLDALRFDDEFAGDDVERLLLIAVYVGVLGKGGALGERIRVPRVLAGHHRAPAMRVRGRRERRLGRGAARHVERTVAPAEGPQLLRGRPPREGARAL